MAISEKYLKFSNGEGLIFLVGPPRSGTTYLQKLLSSHSRIVTGQETHLFDSYIGSALLSWENHSVPNKYGRLGVGLPCYITQDEFYSKLNEFSINLLSSTLEELNSDQFFLEKTPAHSLYLNEISNIFPRAKIIILYRNPIDTCKSLLHAGKTWGKAWAPQKTITAAALWKNYMNAINNSLEIIENKFIKIKYESLIENPENVLTNLFEFLNIKVNTTGITQIINKNSKKSSINGFGGEIKLNGEIAKNTSAGVLKEPDGFVNLKPIKISVFDKIIIWKKTKKICNQNGYSSNILKFIR